MSHPLSELAALVGGTIEGDAALSISGVCGLEAAREGQLSFYGNQRYKKALQATSASAVLVGAEAPARGARTYVRVLNPHLAFARIAQVFHPPRQHAPGVAAGAHLHPEARVDPTATVMSGATVSKGAVVGARAVLYPGVYLGEGASVGADSRLSPNVTIADGCSVGARCILHPSCVIGADGFGFAFDLEKLEHVKIPQAGTVRVEDDVEIGACSCVDRATQGETVVGRGTKIDNLVQVGHNSIIGPYGILCAQVGLSGSTELGTGVIMGGQAGSAGHLRIGDLARVGAQSGIMSDVEAGAEVMGSPVLPVRDWLRSMALVARLPELQKQVRELVRRLAALEKEAPR